MVIQIGALKSGRDADVEADIRAVVEVAHAGGAIVKVIFENAYLTDDEKIRACHADRGRRRRLRQDAHRVRADRRDPRRPAADAREHLAAHPGQGGRRRPDARRAARGDGPRRDADRGDGDRRRSSTTSGRARPGARRRDAPARRQRVGGRLLMATSAGRHRDARLRVHRRVPRRRPALRARTPASSPTTARARSAARRSRERFGSRPLRLIDAVCADPEVDLVVVSLPEPAAPRGRPLGRAPRQGRRLHEAARPERGRGRRDAAARRATPASSTPTSRTSSTTPR